VLTRFVVCGKYLAVPLRDAILPPYTSKVVKSAVLRCASLKLFRKVYQELGPGIKPFSMTPLFRGSRPLFKEQGSSVAPLYVRSGEELWFRVCAVCSAENLDEAPPGDEVVELGPYGIFRFVLSELEVVDIRSLTLGLSGDRVFVRIRFLTPTLLSTKLMAPPLPHFLKRVANIQERYVLFPSPSHLCSYLVKLWNTVAPEEPVSRKVSPEWAAYFVGRLCGVAMVVVDYRSRPITVLYDEKEGVSRRPRGFVGWALYEINTRKLVKILDRALALANYLGVGKSRSIGFGVVTAEKVEPSRSREAYHSPEPGSSTASLYTNYL